MKKIILIISLLIFSNVAWAQKAPEDFRGLKWGSGKEELKKLLGPMIDYKSREERREEEKRAKELAEIRVGGSKERFDRWLAEQIRARERQAEIREEERRTGRNRSDLIRVEDFDLVPDRVYFRAYGRGNWEWEKIGEAKVMQYHFIFHENKFYAVSVSFPKHLSFDIFLKALTMKYGKPQSIAPLVLKINPNAKVGMKYDWIVEDKVGISLSYNDMEDTSVNGSLDYFYLPILDEINKVKNKDAVKTKDKL